MKNNLKYGLHFKVVLCSLFTLFLVDNTYAQSDSNDEDLKKQKKVLDNLTYQQQSGLPVAASKIYFSDSKYTISGFGESNYIHYNGPKNRASNDLELYNTNLQRFVIYGAYKPTDWLVLYGEFFAEFVNDGREESHFEYLPEVFVDFLLTPQFNVRVGSHQPGIGYINNNDEPILFNTVNRPEVERILIPSQWIDMGIMTYGNLTDELKWSASVYQGLDANNLNGATWIRRGRDNTLRFNFNSAVFNSKIQYTGIKNTELSISGLYTQLGRGEEIFSLGTPTQVNANTLLTSAYIRHTHKNWTVMALGTYGQINNTEQLYHLTASSEIGPQVLGKQVYGFYTEVSYDILPLLGFNKKKEGSMNNIIYKREEVKLPVFARIERLNTHASITEALQNAERNQSDMTVLSLGVNFFTKRNIVLKANYQFRWNKEPLPSGEFEGDRVEFGVGFIF